MYHEDLSNHLFLCYFTQIIGGLMIKKSLALSHLTIQTQTYVGVIIYYMLGLILMYCKMI